MTLEEAVSRQDSKVCNTESKTRDVALILLEEIKKSKYHPLPSNVKIEDILKGEGEVPDLLKFFLTI